MLTGVVAGAVLGIVANFALGQNRDFLWWVENVFQTGGLLWLRLLLVLVIPLIFSALVLGIADLDFKQMVRVGLKMVAYTVVVSLIAVLIGMSLVNVLGPGRGAPRELVAQARGAEEPEVVEEGRKVDALELVRNLIPDNVIKAASKGDMIGVIAFSLLFGIGMAVTRTEPARRLREAIQGLYDVTMKLIELVLLLAPFGVGLLVFAMTARLGGGLLTQLASYVGVVLLGLALHMFVVYSLSVWALGAKNPVHFFRDVRLAMLTAFSTASSNATLPTALRVAQENLRLPRHVARFVLTAGSTMNQNGTALFEGVTVLFLAQLFRVPLDFVDQALIMGICVLAGIGTAGVPAGSLPVIAMILVMFDIPPEGLALILGVDRILDMCRTTLNVTGDLAAAVVIARGEPSVVADDPGAGAADAPA